MVMMYDGGEVIVGSGVHGEHTHIQSMVTDVRGQGSNPWQAVEYINRRNYV